MCVMMLGEEAHVCDDVEGWEGEQVNGARQTSRWSQWHVALSPAQTSAAPHQPAPTHMTPTRPHPPKKAPPHEHQHAPISHLEPPPVHTPATLTHPTPPAAVPHLTPPLLCTPVLPTLETLPPNPLPPLQTPLFPHAHTHNQHHTSCLHCLPLSLCTTHLTPPAAAAGARSRRG